MNRKVAPIILCLFAGAFVFSYSCKSPSPQDSIRKDSTSIKAGRVSFTEKCAGCHNFLQDGIGPHLAGVTMERDPQWIKDFIRDPQKMVSSGDSNAVELLREFKTIMPSFSSLPEHELDALLAYMHTFKKTELHLAQEDHNFLSNPITDTIENSGIVVGVSPFLQVPFSSDQQPVTRIVEMDYEPSSGRLFIVDLRGSLYGMRRSADTALPVLYMDMKKLRPKFINQPGLATGFGSFAFHPEFLQNGLLYTTHTEAPKSGRADFSYHDSIPVEVQWVLTEWKADDPSASAFSGKGRELMRINMPTGIHGVQEITFNTTAKKGSKDYGLLYIAIGDGGSTEIRQFFVSPKPSSIWGSIIRIDPRGKNSANGKYGIPVDNPFASSDSAVREIYAWGFRNPHKINWSKAGQLFAVNVGELNIESLNLVEAGHFYGWPIREGTFLIEFAKDKRKVHPLPADDSLMKVTYPVAQFDHDEGTAITGGYEYRGTDVPELQGKYVFGDMASGRLFFVDMSDVRQGKQTPIKTWNISLNGKKTSLLELCGTSRVDMRFGKDAQGELYIFMKRNGKVYKLVSDKGNN